MLSNGPCPNRMTSDGSNGYTIIPSHTMNINCTHGDPGSFASRLPPVTTLKRNFQSAQNDFGHKQSCDNYQPTLSDGNLSSIPIPPISVETLVIPQPVTHHNITISEEGVINSYNNPGQTVTTRSLPVDNSPKESSMRGMGGECGKKSEDFKLSHEKCIRAEVTSLSNEKVLNHPIISISKVRAGKSSILSSPKKVVKMSSNVKSDPKVSNSSTVPSNDSNVIEVLNSLNLGTSFIIIRKNEEGLEDGRDGESQCVDTHEAESVMRVELKDYIEQVLSLRCRLCSFLSTDFDTMLNHVQTHLSSRTDCYPAVCTVAPSTHHTGDILRAHIQQSQPASLSFCHGALKGMGDKCNNLKVFDPLGPSLQSINNQDKSYIENHFIKTELPTNVSSDLSLTTCPITMVTNTLVIPPHMTTISSGGVVASSDNVSASKLTQVELCSADLRDSTLTVSSMAQIVNPSSNSTPILSHTHMPNSLLDFKGVKLSTSLPSALPPDLSSIDSSSLLKQVNLINPPHYEGEDKCDSKREAKVVKKQGRPKGSKNANPSGGSRKKSENSAAEVSLKEKLGTRCYIAGCPVRLKSLENLDYHQKCHHKSDSGHQYCCPQCGEKYTGWKGMSLHLWKLHSLDMELYSCDQCPYKTFSYSKLVNLHKRIHGQERPFLCDHCGKGFKTTKQLRNHKVIHVKKKKVAIMNECNVCQRSFSDKRMLKLHLETVHLKMKPFLCNFCGYSASSRSTLKMHLRVHTGEKPFHCEECSYKTSDHNSLRRHKMRHSGEKKYNCPHCAYACIQSSTFKMHLKNKHPGQAEGLMYSCTKCTYRTVKKDNFAVHWSEHESADKLNEQSEVKEEKTVNEDQFECNESIIQYIGPDMVQIIGPSKPDDAQVLTTCESTLLTDSDSTYLFPNSFQQIIRLTPVTEEDSGHLSYNIQDMQRIPSPTNMDSASEFSICGPGPGDGFHRISYVELQNCPVGEEHDDKDKMTPDGHGGDKRSQANHRGDSHDLKAGASDSPS